MRRSALRGRRLESILIPAVFVVVVGGWEVAVRALRVSELFLPPPSAIMVALVQGFASGLFLHALGVTMFEILAGYLLAAGAAFLLGTLISQIRLLEVTLYPYIVAVQTMPKIAIAPLLIVWVGFGVESKVVVAALVAFFPMLVNTIVGLKATPAEKIDLMRSLAATRWKIFRLVQLPEALPYVFAGLNVGIVLAVLGAIVGEFVGAAAGIGVQLIQFQYQSDVASVFAALVVLAVVGALLSTGIELLRRRVVFWNR